jgi:tetratricopeptide (TPR) repeat protein
VAVESARIEELRRRVEGDPASVSFAALAEEYRRAGRHEDAIATCLAGLGRHSDYVSARVTLGRALMETGKYDAARVEFQRVLRAAPENLAAIRALASLHERRENRQEPDPGDVAAGPSPVATGMAPVAGPIEPLSSTTNPRPDPALSKLDAFLGAIRQARRDTQNPRTGEGS